MIKVTQRTDNHRSFDADNGPRQPCASTKAITQDSKFTGKVAVQPYRQRRPDIAEGQRCIQRQKSESDGGPAHDYSIRHRRRTSTANDQDNAAVVNPTTIALEGTGTKGASPTLSPTM